MDLDSLRIGRERLSRVFQYLEALNQHRNPPKRQIREQLWTLWLKDLPDHPAIQRGRPRNIEENEAETADQSLLGVVDLALRLLKARNFLVRLLHCVLRVFELDALCCNSCRTISASRISFAVTLNLRSDVEMLHVQPPANLAGVKAVGVVVVENCSGVQRLEKLLRRANVKSSGLMRPVPLQQGRDLFQVPAGFIHKAAALAQGLGVRQIVGAQGVSKAFDFVLFPA